jgi:hypothetical protein
MRSHRGTGVASPYVYLVTAMLLAAAAGGVAVYFTYPHIGSPRLVTVFGLVGTTGAGTVPDTVSFTSARSSVTYSAEVTSGSFTTKLPNYDSYNITVSWVGNYTGQRGVVSGGTVEVAVAAGSNSGISHNIVLQTPASMVTVGGSLHWQAVTSTPVAITFTAPDGSTFTASVAADRTFTLRLPNLMVFDVSITAKDSAGQQDSYYAHTFYVSAGVNVVGLLVDLDY